MLKSEVEKYFHSSSMQAITQRMCKIWSAVAGVKRWEEEKDNVDLYFEELSTRRQCIGFLMIQETEVENPAPAIVRVYDYYRQELSVSTVSSFLPVLLNLRFSKQLL
jgi:hypothetical protein